MQELTHPPPETPQQQDKFPPLREAMELVGGKWKLAILHALWEHPKGFAELERSLAPISPRMLSRDLRELDQSNLVWHEARRGGKYALTASGRAIQPTIQHLLNWLEAYQSHL